TWCHGCKRPVCRLASRLKAAWLRGGLRMRRPVYRPSPQTGGSFTARCETGYPVPTQLDVDERNHIMSHPELPAELYFTPSVFGGAEFPPCDFERPALVEERIGPYKIRREFYYADYLPVTSA